MTGVTYGYARVSTDEQTTALQSDALLRHGVTEIFADDGVSGSRPARERPAMAALLSAVRPGDTIVAYSLSRLGRSAVDVLALIGELERDGVAVKLVSEDINTGSPSGRFMLHVLAAMAQFEREVIVERVRAGIAAAKERGTHCGRPSSVSAERRAALLDAVADGLSVSEAARLVGVSRSAAQRIVRGPG